MTESAPHMTETAWQAQRKRLSIIARKACHWTNMHSSASKDRTENKSESNNTSEFISPPIFVGLGSNSAWPCAANWCTNTLCYIFPSFTLRILFLQINYLPEFLLCNTQARNLQSAAYLCLCPRSGNVYRLVFFSFFCSDKNRKLDLDFQVVCQNRQKLEMTFATKCINKEFQYK